MNCVNSGWFVGVTPDLHTIIYIWNTPSPKLLKSNYNYFFIIIFFYLVLQPKVTRENAEWYYDKTVFLTAAELETKL